MPNPTVSAIIPAYNASGHIALAIESVMAQHFGVKELICINDGSTDDTSGVVEKFKEKYPDKINLVTIPNSGAAAARNKGIDISTGDYLQFLDADDIILPAKLRQQEKLLTSSADIPDMIAGSSYRINNRGEKKKISVNTNPWKGLISSSLGNTCANLFSREILIKAGKWNPVLGSSQEYDLMFRILKKGGKIAIDQEPQTIVYDRTNSISSTNIDKNWDRYIHLRHQIYTYLKETKLLDDDLKQFVLQEIFNAIRILFTLNKTAAIKWHQSIFSQEIFTPQPRGATSRTYLYLYKILGFPAADNVSLLLNSIKLKGKKPQLSYFY